MDALIPNDSQGVYFVASSEYSNYHYQRRTNLHKKEEHDDIEHKVRSFRTTSGVRQAIHPVLVTTYGLANNQYSRIFQNVVTLKDLFK